jgi:hypothetical protein
MKKIIGITLAVLGLAAIASAQDVRYNFDKEADFSKFKTYKWVEMPGGVKLDDLLARQLTSAFEAGLTAKGLSKVDSDNADLVIGYVAAVQQEQQVNAYSTGGFGYGRGWGGGMGGMTTATITTLTVGSVSLDMYEVASKHLVWRGTATKTVDVNAKPDKRQKNITNGVTKLLKNYPPKKK